MENSVKGLVKNVNDVLLLVSRNVAGINIKYVNGSVQYRYVSQAVALDPIVWHCAALSKERKGELSSPSLTARGSSTFGLRTLFGEIWLQQSFCENCQANQRHNCKFSSDSIHSH